MGIGPWLAILIAAAVAALALSLRGKTPEGLALGLGMQLAGLLAWTLLDRDPRPAVWVTYAFLGAVAASSTYPWWPHAGRLPRLGSAWLGVSLYAFGAMAAALVGAWSIALERMIYAGFAALLALWVVRTIVERGRDPTIGLAAGLLLSHAALLIAGSPWVFTAGPRFASPTAWGDGMSDRFWGGPWLLFHPNAIAMTALITVARIGPDPRFAFWQRLGSLGSAALLLHLAGSRTALAIALFASALYFWRTITTERTFSRPATVRGRPRSLARAALPLAATLLVLFTSGGVDLLVKERYPKEFPEEHWPFSGRSELWVMVGRDWREDGLAEQLLGNTDSTRGILLRHRDPLHPEYATQPKLGADNIAVSALRRGGLLGLLAFAFALVALIRHVTSPGLPCWIPLSTLPLLLWGTMEDELVFASVPWLTVLAAEAWAVWRPAARTA